MFCLVLTFSEKKEKKVFVGHLKKGLMFNPYFEQKTNNNNKMSNVAHSFHFGDLKKCLFVYFTVFFNQ